MHAGNPGAAITPGSILSASGSFCAPHILPVELLRAEWKQAAIIGLHCFAAAMRIDSSRVGSCGGVPNNLPARPFSSVPTMRPVSAMKRRGGFLEAGPLNTRPRSGSMTTPTGPISSTGVVSPSDVLSPSKARSGRLKDIAKRAPMVPPAGPYDLTPDTPAHMISSNEPSRNLWTKPIDGRSTRPVDLSGHPIAHSFGETKLLGRHCSRCALGRGRPALRRGEGGPSTGSG